MNICYKYLIICNKVVYIFYNIVYALSAYPLGILADKIGLKWIFVSGLLLFAIVYGGMAFKGNLYYYLFLFFLYGLYAAATEGISKAWISNITDAADTATAIGTYTGFQSICTMLASFITGWVWFRFGAAFAFWTTAIVAIIVVVYCLLVIPKPENKKK